MSKLCADVEVQAGNKPYWFKVDENGEFVGGISKFLRMTAGDSSPRLSA